MARGPAGLAALLRDARCVLAWRADFDARVLAQTAAVHNLALAPIKWADVRPAYVDARRVAGTASPMQCAAKACGGKDDTTAPKPTAGRCSL